MRRVFWDSRLVKPAMPTSWADASEGDEARGAGDSMPGNHADRVARYVQAAEAR